MVKCTIFFWWNHWNPSFFAKSPPSFPTLVVLVPLVAWCFWIKPVDNACHALPRCRQGQGTSVNISCKRLGFCLWWTNTTMENHHFSLVNHLFLWPMFSSYVSSLEGNMIYPRKSGIFTKHWKHIGSQPRKIGSSAAKKWPGWWS